MARPITFQPTASDTDGTTLTNLSGFTVHYGQAPRAYEASVWVGGATTSSVVLQGLASGTWYFAVKARNSAGVQSAYPAEVVKTL